MKKIDNLADLGVDVRIILSGSRSGIEKYRLDFTDSG